MNTQQASQQTQHTPSSPARQHEPERTEGARSSGPHADILRLQRAAGNGAVSQILRQRSALAGTPVIQRQVAGPEPSGVCPVCGRRGKGRCPGCGQAFRPIQRSATGPLPGQPDLSTIGAVLHAGSGQPLEPGTRRRMEEHFGQDFRQVRVHTGSQAAESAQALNARAYTVGRDIIFRAGLYAPQTGEGQRLLAHELTHVVQQGTGAVTVPPDRLSLGPVGDHFEQQAEQVAAAIGRNQPAPTPRQNTAPRVQRDIFDKDQDKDLFGGKGKGKERPGAFKHGSTLPYREATELNKCINIMGVENAQYCRGEVLGEKPGPEHVSKLLKDFGAKFKDGANLIRKNQEAMALVFEAEGKNVKFGGYAEEGPGKNAWAYTITNTVYVPKARTDAVVAVSDFLFELNNAIRDPKFAEIYKEARKGSKGTMTPQAYARQMIEQEVEGMLRTGEVWFDLKAQSGKGAELDKYDKDFFLSEYKAVKDKTKTKDDVVNDVLQRKYTSGKNKDKTTEEYYMDQYKNISGGK